MGQLSNRSLVRQRAATSKVRSILGSLRSPASAHFPCFTDDSISGYPALLYDLENLLSPFFTGAEDDFISIATQYMQTQQQQQKTDSRDLTYHATGEDRLKARARELFREGRYEEVLR